MGEEVGRDSVNAHLPKVRWERFSEYSPAKGEWERFSEYTPVVCEELGEIQ